MHQAERKLPEAAGSVSGYSECEVSVTFCAKFSLLTASPPPANSGTTASGDPSRRRTSTPAPLPLRSRPRSGCGWETSPDSPHFRSTVSLTEQICSPEQCNKWSRRSVADSVPLPRPKSWSPDPARRGRMFGDDPTPPQTPKRKSSRQRFGTDPSCYLIYQAREKVEETTEVCENEEPENTGSPQRLPRVNSVKERISELEGQPKRKRSSTQAVKINSRAGLVLNLANQFESATFYSNRSSPSTRNPHDKHSRSFNLHDMSKPPIPRGRPPIPKRGESRMTHGTSVNLFSRRGSKTAQVTPEREDGFQRKNAFMQSIIMTDLSVVPQGTVSKTKEKIENLKRTHSFENPLTRQTSRSILKIGLSIESLN